MSVPRVCACVREDKPTREREREVKHSARDKIRNSECETSVEKKVRRRKKILEKNPPKKGNEQEDSLAKSSRL